MLTQRPELTSGQSVNLEAVAPVGVDVGVTDRAEPRKRVVADEFGLLAADVVEGDGQVGVDCLTGRKRRIALDEAIRSSSQP